MSTDAFAGRSNSINYDVISGLTYLGNYTRRLPVSIVRMMENAFDWEHLPYVHRSSFAAIQGVDEGRWGWRAKGYLNFGDVGPEPNDFNRVSETSAQFIELLVDADRHYWATTVVAGVGEGTQIHTQATSIGEHEIEIDVRFYVDGVELSESDKAAIYDVLKQQYATLYDEDTALMQGRQSALDDRKSHCVGNDTKPFFVGNVSEIEQQLPKLIRFDGKRFCINRWRGEWVIYSADCPHMMGPLEGEKIADDGTVTCPWHGYRFNVSSGELCEGRSGNLVAAPVLEIDQGKLFLS